MQINHTMLLVLMAYLIAIHVAVFMLIRTIGKLKQRVKNTERQD